MKERVVCHIGFHKTGTTLLQRSLFPSIRDVELTPRQVIRDTLLNTPTLGFDPAAVRAVLLPAQSKTMVVSHEELSGNPHTGGGGGFVAAEIARRLHATWPDAKVLITVRNQAAVVESWYRQYVKEGGTLSLADLLDSDHDWNFRFPAFKLEHFEYQKLASYYVRLFGAERVYILTHEQMCRNPAGFLRDLLALLGCDPIGYEDILPRMARRENPGMTATALSTLRLVNRLTLSSPRQLWARPRLRRALAGRIRRLDLSLPGYDLRKVQPLMSDTERRLIEDYVREDNGKLQELVSDDLEALGYAMPCRSPHESRLAGPAKTQ